jgi:hypothetical protein
MSWMIRINDTSRTEDLAQTVSRLRPPARSEVSVRSAPHACLPVYRLRKGERRWTLRVARGCVVR